MLIISEKTRQLYALFHSIISIILAIILIFVLLYFVKVYYSRYFHFSLDLVCKCSSYLALSRRVGPKLSGMLGYCSFSQPLLEQTLDPKPSIAPLCRHWRHTTILRMVIIAITRIITLNEIILFITYYTYYDVYVDKLCIAGWLKSVGSKIL